MKYLNRSFQSTKKDFRRKYVDFCKSVYINDIVYEKFNHLSVCLQTIPVDQPNSVAHILNSDLKLIAVRSKAWLVNANPN